MLAKKKPSQDLIPVNEPLLDGAATENVMTAMRGGWISSEGPFVAEFERLWAAYCGMPHGIAVCNGTVALELAMANLGLRDGDEVIIPSFTIISCALAVIEAGAKPVLVDCDPETWCMDVDQLASKISSRTKAIMPVHIYGHPVDMAPVMALASRHGLVVVEDAAEAHGAEYKGKRVGGFGDMSCFSFYANKIVTTGEGGMILARDGAATERLRSGRNLSFRSDRRFYHTELGHNYRLTNVQAAIGVAQVRAVDEHVRLKREMGQFYARRLARVRGLQLPAERPWAKNVYWMYGIVLNEDVPMNATRLAELLRERGVDTRPFFVGMHEQPVLRGLGLFEGEKYKETERISRRGLYLPSGLTITRQQQETVCAAVEDALAS